MKTMLRLMGLVVLVLASSVLAAPSVEAVGPDNYHFATVIKGPNVPPSGSWSFDISFVDETSGMYFLADRTNKGVDVVNAESNSFVGTIPGFVGVAASRSKSGPNGVVTDSSGMVWAGDGDSTIKLADPQTMSVIKTISTCLAGLTAAQCMRADELSFSPLNGGIIVIANDAAVNASNQLQPFLTFVSVASRSVIGHIVYPVGTEGLEQSVWDSAAGLFYQAVPASAGGHIDTIDPTSMTIVASHSYPGCSGGPSGLALDPTHQRFIAACGNEGLVVDVSSGAILASISQVGGADEVWYNSGDKHYYLAEFGGQLGIVDANSNKFIQNVASGPAAHSVAAFADNRHASNPANNKVFVPVGGSGINVYQR